MVETVYFLEMCDWYPEMNSNIVLGAIRKIMPHLNLDDGERLLFARNGGVCQFSSVAHDCMVLVRYLPHTRVLALK